MECPTTDVARFEAPMGLPLVQAGVPLRLHVPESRFSHPCTPTRSPGSRALWLAGRPAEQGVPAPERTPDHEDVANCGSAMVGCARLLTSVRPCGPMELVFPSA